MAGFLILGMIVIGVLVILLWITNGNWIEAVMALSSLMIITILALWCFPVPEKHADQNDQQKAETTQASPKV